MESKGVALAAHRRRVQAGAIATAKAAVRAALSRTGYTVKKVSPARVDRGFYPVAPTCQIQNLGFLYETILGATSDGFFVEVGAYDGYTFSNTSGLAERGWRGILVEPVPRFADQCRARYGHLPGITVAQTAIGSEPGAVELLVAGTLTTANPDLAAEYLDVDWSSASARSGYRVTVEKTTLDLLLRSLDAPVGFDVLAVDVEGFEREVFAGFDLAAWHPKMLIVELADLHPDLSATRAADAALARSIRSAGYSIVAKDKINTVFVRDDVLEHALG